MSEVTEGKSPVPVLTEGRSPVPVLTEGKSPVPSRTVEAIGYKLLSIYLFGVHALASFFLVCGNAPVLSTEGLTCLKSWLLPLQGSPISFSE